MTKLIATSPIGKNGQTVVPAPIRKIFKLHLSHMKLGFFLHDGHVEIAPVEERRGDYSIEDLAKLESLAKEPGGKTFKSAKSAKKYLASL
jgi:bifunctional DNA-binding transcriptional regulator/antitoxin component of YhaV-PrlF toxin-antitoxin module